jgi:predicted ferric reductase
MFLGGLTGLVGTYLALVMVLLVSRVPWVERALGQDGLVRWHRRLAAWPVSLIAAHAVLLVIAYAQAAHTGTMHELGTLVGTFPWMLEATVGFGLMMLIALVSVKAIRKRVSRERWWAFHLGMYLALALSFAHVIALGPSFVGHPLARLLWVLYWLATAGLVLAYRFGLPVVRTLRHGLEVVEVRRESHDVVSVICRGRNLDKLAVSGGQFFEWRFLARGMWWQAHPFTMSAKPTPPFLRLTVKGLGDFSQSLAELRPGTKVAIEGPYGVFTAHARKRRKALLIAGGIGVTAARALLEDLPVSAEPVVVLRATSERDLVLAAEVAELASRRKGTVHELVGDRNAVRLERLAQLVPDLRKRDIYISGPEGFVKSVVTMVGRMGVPAEAVHYEAYELP